MKKLFFSIFIFIQYNLYSADIITFPQRDPRKMHHLSQAALSVSELSFIIKPLAENPEGRLSLLIQLTKLDPMIFRQEYDHRQSVQLFSELLENPNPRIWANYFFNSIKKNVYTDHEIRMAIEAGELFTPLEKKVLLTHILTIFPTYFYIIDNTQVRFLNYIQSLNLFPPESIQSFIELFNVRAFNSFTFHVNRIEPGNGDFEQHIIGLLEKLSFTPKEASIIFRNNYFQDKFLYRQYSKVKFNAEFFSQLLTFMSRPDSYSSFLSDIVQNFLAQSLGFQEFFTRKNPYISFENRIFYKIFGPRLSEYFYKMLFENPFFATHPHDIRPKIAFLFPPPVKYLINPEQYVRILVQAKVYMINKESIYLRYSIKSVLDQFFDDYSELKYKLVQHILEYPQIYQEDLFWSMYRIMLSTEDAHLRNNIFKLISSDVLSHKLHREAILELYQNPKFKNLVKEFFLSHKIIEPTPSYLRVSSSLKLNGNVLALRSATPAHKLKCLSFLKKFFGN